MTARIVVRLTCENCPATYIGEPDDDMAETRFAAEAEGWTHTSLDHPDGLDYCPQEASTRTNSN